MSEHQRDKYTMRIVEIARELCYTQDVVTLTGLRSELNRLFDHLIEDLDKEIDEDEHETV